MIICSTCNKSKNRSEYETRKGSSNGYRRQCKACLKVHYKRYKTSTKGKETIKQNRIKNIVKHKARAIEYKNKIKADPVKLAEYREKRKKYIKPKGEGHHRKYLLSKYGISVNIYNDLAAKQGGKCGICEKTTKVLCVDHCHKTYKFRGLLCRQCNSAIGLLKDNPTNIKNALTYIEKHITINSNE